MELQSHSSILAGSVGTLTCRHGVRSCEQLPHAVDCGGIAHPTARRRARRASPRARRAPSPRRSPRPRSAPPCAKPCATARVHASAGGLHRRVVRAARRADARPRSTTRSPARPAGDATQVVVEHPGRVPQRRERRARGTPSRRRVCPAIPPPPRQPPTRCRRPSMRPNFRWMRMASSATADRSARSQTRVSTPGTASASASSAPRRVPTASTVAPAATSARATASPLALVAPAMSTIVRDAVGPRLRPGAARRSRRIRAQASRRSP